MRVLFVHIFMILVSQFAYGNNSRIIEAYMNFGYDGYDNELISQHVESTDAYISSYTGNKSTAEFIGLMNLHANAQNYLNLSEALSNCNDNDRNLTTRILNVVGTEIKANGLFSAPCPSVFFTPGNEVENYISENSMLDATQILTANELEKSLHKTSVVNSFKALMLHDFQFKTQNFNFDNQIIDFINTHCENQCSTDIYNRSSPNTSPLFSILKQYRQQIAEERRFNSQEAADYLNNIIDGEAGLNRLLEEIEREVGSEGSGVRNRSNFDFTSNMMLGYYQSRYAEIATMDPVGRLLNTSDLRDRVREPREPGFWDTRTRGYREEFKQHRTVSSNQISTARDEVRETISDQIAELNQNERTRRLQEEAYITPPNGNRRLAGPSPHLGMRDFQNYRMEALQRLISTNPRAVGQELFQNPGYASTVCSVISNISESDSDRRFRDNVWLYGGLFVGGALLLTGIGAGIGAMVLTGTTATTLGTIAATSGIVGTAVGLAEAGYQTNRYFEARAVAETLERSILSANADTESYNEALAAVREMREARFAAIMAGAFTVAELGIFAKFATIATRGISNGMDAINNSRRLSNALSRIYTNPRYMRVVTSLREISDRSGEYLAMLLNMSENTQTIILNRISRMLDNGDTAGVRRMMDEALEVSGTACRF